MAKSSSRSNRRSGWPSRSLIQPDTGAGIYIINQLGANIVDHLQKRTIYKQRLAHPQRAGLLDPCRPAGEEWGFMLPDRSGFTMARTDPALWEQILAQPDGQAAHNGGYFTWRRVVPPRSILVRPGPVSADDSFIVIASEIGSDEWADNFTGLRAGLAAAIAAIVLLVFFGHRFFEQRAVRNRTWTAFSPWPTI